MIASVSEEQEQQQEQQQEPQQEQQQEQQHEEEQQIKHKQSLYREKDEYRLREQLEHEEKQEEGEFDQEQKQGYHEEPYQNQQQANEQQREGKQQQIEHQQKQQKQQNKMKNNQNRHEASDATRLSILREETPNGKSAVNSNRINPYEDYGNTYEIIGKDDGQIYRSMNDSRDDLEFIDDESRYHSALLDPDHTIIAEDRTIEFIYARDETMDELDIESRTNKKNDDNDDSSNNKIHFGFGAYSNASNRLPSVTTNNNNNNDYSTTSSNQHFAGKLFLGKILHWTFRVNFFVLFAVMCLGYFLLVTLFAFPILLAGFSDPDCVRITTQAFNYAHSPFADAFNLSWVTFSTVGYGSAYPALGFQNNSRTNCALITVMTSLESFVGILFAGLCGAILFGKVLRLQSQAQVMFSDPIIIRYGQGVAYDEYDYSTAFQKHCKMKINKKTSSATSKEYWPFPVMEFRIVNRLFNENSGEIMDATLNVVAKVEEHHTIKRHQQAQRKHFLLERVRQHSSPPDRRAQLTSQSSQAKLTTSGTTTSEPTTTSQDSLFLNTDEYDLLRENLGTRFRGVARGIIAAKRLARSRSNLSWISASSSRSSEKMDFDRSRHSLQEAIAIDRGEDVVNNDNISTLNDLNSNISTNNQLYYKLSLDTAEHPFFKRVWIVRHILDSQSPILKQHVKDMILENKGYWPYHKLSTAHDIRESIHFKQVLVSLSGVSNVSASTVYAQKIYDFLDVKVGYQFEDIIRHYADKSIGVDIENINVVTEQIGGGGEPLV